MANWNAIGGAAGGLAQGFSTGVQVGIKLRQAMENTREVMDQRARREVAKQVGEQAAKDMKAIDAPVAELDSREQLYNEQVLLGEMAEDPKQRLKFKAERAMVESKAIRQRIDYGQNLIFAHPDNEMIQDSYKQVVSDNMDRWEAMQQNMRQEVEIAEKQRAEGVAIEQDTAQREHEVTAREDEQRATRAEQKRSLYNQIKLERERDFLMRGRVKDGVTVPKGSRGSKDPKWLDMYNKAIETADKDVSSFSDEELQPEADAAGVPLPQYRRQLVNSRTRSLMQVEGAPTEIIGSFLGPEADEEDADAGEGGEEAGENESPEAAAERLLGSENLSDEARARLEKATREYKSRKKAVKKRSPEDEEAEALADSIENSFIDKVREDMTKGLKYSGWGN